ncbi:outer membrane receptor protein involved in Fe transport [Variovorax paradoxus]|uniref:Outer membrane receptor protein involved in Fe transport n=1 Tax=Variovorax paradoxus TaxID=34073 RepID=A0AAE3Y0M9_VARPD|nr:TonB-dependent receptor [Variovorax paradoxus]MDR6427372.1 outer membrane receptor protein involved in Fe transport [Variovorax paradoxus]MDR6454534.1 outer membrane receptor protein involved in Fe transport [Variovorax paradoxus]
MNRIAPRPGMPSKKKRTYAAAALRPWVIGGAWALASGMSAHAQTQAQTQMPAHGFDVGGGDLKTALDAYIAQGGVQLLYKVDDVEGVATRGVKGALSPQDALAQLLEGTQLRTRRGDDGAIVIYTAAAAAKPLADEAPQSLDSVTITATRRREPVREIPMQVNVMKAQALERAGAKNLADYVAEQPGVNLTSSGSVGGTLTMRGLTMGPVQGIATVGVYVDDVATGLSSAGANGGNTPLDMGMLDLSHIEVLRGPQGTLYGAGAMSGVLKYVTNQPDTMELAGSVRFGTSWTQGGGPGFMTGAVLNVPLKEDVAAIRFAAFTDQIGGSYDATGLASGRNIDRGHTDGGRVSLLLTPTRELTVRLTGTVQDVHRKGLGFEETDKRTLRPWNRERSRQLSASESYRNLTQLFGLDVEYDFGWARLNSITSAQDVKINNSVDVTGLYGPLLSAMRVPVASVPIISTVEQHRVSQEFRLTSRSGTTIEWLAGLYLNRERGSNNGSMDADLIGGRGSLGLLTSTQSSRYREEAAYGDITWNVTPAFSLTGGVRLARNHQKYASRQTGQLIGSVAANAAGTSSESPTTYLAAAKYSLSDTSTVYFRAASGYRPGGPNVLKANTDRNVVQPMYNSDSLWSYELGYKADLLDRTLSLEAALYDIEWSGVQQPTRSGGFTFVTNAGAARIKGSELTLNWKPSKEWRFTANAAAIDARLTEDATGLGAKAGTRLPHTPRFATTLGVTRSFSLADHPAYVGISARYTGKRDAGYRGSTALPSIMMPAYTLVDLQAGIDFKRFSVSAYVRNLTNRRGIVSIETGLNANPNLVTAALVPARTIGVNVNVPF